MKNGEEIQVQSQAEITQWTPAEVMGQVKMIQHLMKEGMTEGEHWGIIPGCGTKPTLLKPGAEKLCLMFRLAPKFDVQDKDLGNGHREITVKCTLIHINTGKFWGEGVGSCSTMESKYRYRSGAGESTGVQVPKAYWDKKKVDFKGAQELIGGSGYSTKKIDGVWFIVEKIEKQENPDIADTYNTVLKIAKKRALVDASITATAASDIFTQDIEEMVPGGEEKVKETTAQREEKTDTAWIDQRPPEDFINYEQQMGLFKMAKDKGLDQKGIKEYLKGLGADRWSKIKKEDHVKVYEYISGLDASGVGQ